MGFRVLGLRVVFDPVEAARLGGVPSPDLRQRLSCLPARMSPACRDLPHLSRHFAVFVQLAMIRPVLGRFETRERFCEHCRVLGGSDAVGPKRTAPYKVS